MSKDDRCAVTVATGAAIGREFINLVREVWADVNHLPWEALCGDLYSLSGTALPIEDMWDREAHAALGKLLPKLVEGLKRHDLPIETPVNCAADPHVCERLINDLECLVADLSHCELNEASRAKKVKKTTRLTGSARDKAVTDHLKTCKKAKEKRPDARKLAQQFQCSHKTISKLSAWQNYETLGTPYFEKQNSDDGLQKLLRDHYDNFEPSPLE